MAEAIAKIRHRIDLAAYWTATNPILLRGEAGFEEDTAGFKIGDGVTAWTGLPYRVAATAFVPVLSLTGTVPTTGTVGVSGAFTLTASGGTAPYVFGHSGTIPTGLTFVSSGTTAGFTGSLTAAGTYVGAITVTDADGTTAIANYAIVVSAGTGTAPAITTQPSAQSVTAPTTATFTVAASGTAPLTYQWQRNATNISGATSASYTTPATAVTGGAANNGDAYRCVVTNAAGSVTSNAATLTVAASDSTAPTFASAQVTNAAPNVIAISMSEALAAGFVPAASAFAASGKTVSSVALSGSTINVTVNSAYANGDTITVTYTKPGSNPLQDAAGNQTASFGPVSVTNNVAATGTAGTLQFSATNYAAAEGTATVTVTVTRAGGSTGAASVAYATSNGSATAGSDYTAASGTLNWTNGDAASKTFTVAITDDATVESAETITVTLSSATGATLGSQTTATITIADNDSSGPDATPSFSYGLANSAGDSSAFATIFGTTTPLTGATSGGRTGGFSTTSSVTNYTWLKVKASAAGTTLRVFDGTTYGGFSGAKSAGIGATPTDEDPIADAFLTWTDGNGVVWNCYRSNGKASTASGFSIL